MKRNDRRYEAIDKKLAKYVKMKPTVWRFCKLCANLKEGIEIALSGDVDFDVWQSCWLAATLKLMTEDPCAGDCDLIERGNLFNSVFPAFERLVDLYNAYRLSLDNDACVEEYDSFYQDVNSVIMRNLHADSDTGRRQIEITPEFVTREGNDGAWHFDATNIRILSSHCTAEQSVEKFVAMPITESGQLMVDANNSSVSGAEDGNLAVYLTFRLAISDAETKIPAFEKADDDTLMTLLADGGTLISIFQPFFGTYYDPYTYYEKRLEKDKELGLDIAETIMTLKRWIDRLFIRLKKLVTASDAVSSAINCWQQISSLYDFRMNNPYSRLSCREQESYRARFVALNGAISRINPVFGVDSTDPNNDSECASPTKNVVGPRYDEQGRMIVVMDGVTPNGAKALREAKKDKGGRPKGSKRDGSHLSQGDVAKMFGSPCNANKVSNWERFVRTDGKEGAMPPSANVNGKWVSYRTELRENYTGENCRILAAIIENFKSVHAVKTRLGTEKIVHAKNDETLYRMQHPDGRVR